jgi:exosortase
MSVATNDSETGSAQPALVELSPRTFFVGLGILVAILAGSFAYFLRSQFEYAIAFPDDWGHTLLVPAIAGWLIFRDRAKISALQPFQPSWFGLPVVMLGLLVYIVAFPGVGPKWLPVHHNVRQLGVAATIFGVALSLFGWRPMRYLWFPLAYLVIFGTTYTDRILQIVTERLQDISAVGGYFLLLVLGNDVDLAGNSITIHPAGTEADGVTPLSPIPLNVAEACSGMRMLVAFMALGTLMAYIGLKQWWQRILLMLLAIPVAVFVNVLRVATLGVLSLWDRGFSDGQFHTFVGFVWLVPAFLVFLGLMEIVRRLVVDAPSEPRNGPPEKSAT